MPLHVTKLPDNSRLIRKYPAGADPDEAFAEMADYIGACVMTLVDGIARVEGAVAKWQHPLTRQDIVSIINIARGIGASELRIKRAPGHIMPRMFTLIDEEWVIKL